MKTFPLLFINTVRIWQSILSVIPPCPGIIFAKSFIFKARLNPEAKNPPKGEIKLANKLNTRE